MDFRVVWFRAFLTGLLAIGLGCSSAGLGNLDTAITPAELLAGEALGGVPHPERLVAGEDVLSVSEGMLEFLDANVHPKAFDGVRLQELIDAIINEGTFGLEFDGQTRTAAETFRLRRGNCLSFSNMFVAMARRVNLDASFQEVDIPPDWGFENDVFILNRHVNVHIDMGELGVHVVDFNIDDFKSSYDSRTISDARARAHYFNNMGVESMQAGDTAAALGYFRKAVAENDNQFSPAWSNLGTLYLRLGHPSYAEAAYLYALEVDDEDLVAMSNLARFYEQQGDSERASFYRKRVKEHRRKNPYYRYQRARDAYSSGDYDAAIKHLKYAIREKKNEDQFYHLLGLCQLQKGNQRAARRWLAKARQVASTDALKSRYSRKLELLQSASASP
jgi:Flp pilus assembly protein TadD